MGESNEPCLSSNKVSQPLDSKEWHDLLATFVQIDTEIRLILVGHTMANWVHKTQL